MRIEVVTTSTKNTGVRSMRLVHGTEEIHWDTVGYASSSISNRDELFTDINILLESLPLDTQAQVFQIYKNINDIMIGDPSSSNYEMLEDNDAGYAYMNSKLMPEINKLYQLIDYKVFRTYVYQSGNVEFLPGLKTEYADKDRWTKDFEKRTYLLPDYIELVIVILALRLMVPIWGVHLAMGKQHSGNIYKERSSMRLVETSALYSYPGMERALTYVEATLADTSASLPMVLGGLSTMETPRYLVALVVLRKLSVAPVSARSSDDDYAKIIYNFVRGTFKRLDGTMGGRIGTKKMPSESGAADDNSAITDMWKINEDVRSGDIAIIETYSKNIHHMCEYICPEIEKAKIDECLALLPRIHGDNLQGPQQFLTMWTVGKVISPSSVGVIGVPSQINYLIAAQAVLWEWGFHQLAALITAEPIRLDAAGDWVIQETRSKISRALMEKLDAKYPHYRRESRESDRDKRVNHTARAIERFVDETSMFVWRSRVPKRLAEHVTGNVTPMGQLIIPSDIRNQLAMLALKI